MARLTARQQERAAALRPAPRAPEAPPVARTPHGEAGPRLVAVGAKGHLGANVAAAVAEGLRGPSPGPLD